MSTLDPWLARKTAKPRTIRSARDVSYRHARGPGPGSYFAQLALRVKPAVEFGFVWGASELSTDRPNDALYRTAVIDGVLDELIVPAPELLENPFEKQPCCAVINVHVTVVNIVFHPVDSNPRAFYSAARGAIRLALRSEDGRNNIE